MKKLILIMFVASLASGCKKADTGGCWECKDAQGNPVNTICADSEQDAFNNSGNINGVHDLSTFRQYCQKK